MGDQSSDMSEGRCAKVRGTKFARNQKPIIWYMSNVKECFLLGEKKSKKMKGTTNEILTATLG